jgi:hypothetical protein
MIYKLDDLLTKMGAPEVQEKNRIEWHYFDKAHSDLAGYAEVRLEAGGQRLVADLKHMRENYEDDHGNIHAQFEETFHLVAERAGPERYRIARVAFDGASYSDPPRAVTELALSIFHARALDISILMVEQAFNKMDITDVAEEAEFPAHGRRAIFSRLDSVPQRANFGVVIPFRPREPQQRAANA